MDGSQSPNGTNGQAVDAGPDSMTRDMAQGVSGYELVLSGVVFALAGVWIDKKLETTPLFILVLSVLGFGGSALNIYYRYNREMREHEAEAAARRKGPA